MNKKEGTILVLILAAVLILPNIAAAAATPGTFESVIQQFLPTVEGFTASPVWDVSQWSWGYGTAAGYDRRNKPPGTISREQAMADSMTVINSAYNRLAPQISRTLNPYQWAALLSFSYNEGPGNAENLLDDLNSGTDGNDQALFDHMRLYHFAGGVSNRGLINRREKEITLWQS